ncbi:MAG: YraN family protein [Puniceicoccales bacterium]|jgi:putative endonuclease|nr:YraN family protein [Puniceicoccales bacterium]
MKIRWPQTLAAWLRRIFQRRKLTPAMRLGMKGEDLAAARMRKDGMKILARNWRDGRDEIDIVALDDGELVFAEVKTRTIGGARLHPDGYSAVNRRKRTALARVCRAYMRALETPPRLYRFDIVEVEVNADGEAQIYHQRYVPLFEAANGGRRGRAYIR